MTVRIYVPRDAAAIALGAHEVAAAVANEIVSRGLDASVVRNGSRGMHWIEPLVEVDTPAGRIAYGPVSVADVASLFDADFLNGGSHALALGATEEIPFFARQTRLTFARCGITDPVSLADYEAHGGLVGLKAAIAMTPSDVVPLESYAEAGIERLLGDWKWVSLFFNRVNAAMGKNPLYPFDISGPVADKLGFVHHVVRQRS